LVQAGQLFRGVTGLAGEFGHMTIDPNGKVCNCGNRGCWETQVSQSALFCHIRQMIESRHSTVLSEMVAGKLEQLTVPAVVEAARQNDQVALKALNRVGKDLGTGIASLVNIFNPDMVVLGGMLSLAAEFLLPVIKDEIKQRALSWNVSATEIVSAKHGFDACVMGGIAMVYQTMLAHPGILPHQRYRFYPKVILSNTK
jgi:predicted NBD/HSP70 family sugar kinase